MDKKCTGEKKKILGHVIAIIVTNIIILTAYHYYFIEGSKKKYFYTSNARTVLNSLYKKAIKGEIEQKMFESILTNMEKQLKELALNNPESIVMVKEAVVMGADPIVFDQAGNIITDPEKKKMELMQERRFYENSGTQSERELDDAIQEFKDSFGKQQNNPRTR